MAAKSKQEPVTKNLLRQRPPVEIAPANDTAKNVCKNVHQDESDDESHEGLQEGTPEVVLQLKRRVGIFSGVALIVGTMIGSGIFVSSGNLLARTKSPGLCIVLWAACGVYSLLGAISYAEIGTLIPKSGGEYIYFLEAFGPLHRFFGPVLAFLYAWVVVFLLKPSALAILSLSFAKYLTSPFYSYFHICMDSNSSYIVARMIAAVCIGLISFVNCFSVTLATRVQNVFTVAKLSAIGIIIVGGLYYIVTGHTQNLSVGFQGSETSISEIAQAFYGGLWAYDGWNNLNFVTEELVNPYRNLPLAIVIGIPLTMACYIMINVAYLAVLTPSEIINSPAVAVLWGERVLGAASFLIPLGVVMSVFGTANGSVFTAGRISQAAGRQGHMIDVMSFVHVQRRTPVAPILLNAFLGLLMIIPGDIGTLIDFFGFTSAIFYGAAMAALIVMRYTKKDELRPIRVPIVIPIFVMIVSVYLVIGPIASNPQIQYVYALLFILAGLIFYVPFVYYKKVLPGIGHVTIFLQKLVSVLPIEQ